MNGTDWSQVPCDLEKHYKTHGILQQEHIFIYALMYRGLRTTKINSPILAESIRFVVDFVPRYNAFHPLSVALNPYRVAEHTQGRCRKYKLPRWIYADYDVSKIIKFFDQRCIKFMKL